MSDGRGRGATDTILAATGVRVKEVENDRELGRRLRAGEHPCSLGRVIFTVKEIAQALKREERERRALTRSHCRFHSRLACRW